MIGILVESFSHSVLLDHVLLHIEAEKLIFRKFRAKHPHLQLI